MSADNGIYILRSKTKYKETSPGLFENLREPIDVWRVAHAQGIDNLDWYKQNEPWNVGAYLHSVFGKSKVYYSHSEANKQAYLLAEECDVLEYGIGSFNLDDWSMTLFQRPFVFFGDHG